MSFLDGRRLRSDSSNNEDDDCDLALGEAMSFKTETQPTDEMEADNDDLMQQFQSMATPQALRRLSHSISLASAAAEEQAAAPTVTPTPIGRPSAVEAAAASSCHCAKRVDEQVNFLEGLEREEQQLIQSTSQDLARCKNILHVGDSDYNFLISFLPLMKQMSPLQNVTFRAKMGELLLQTMQQSQQPQQQQLAQQQQQLLTQQQQRQPQEEQPQPSQMLLNQQQMALDQAQQVTTSTTNWN
ncbi:serine/threonine-protein kinase phg2 isoform X2 [Drosophila montana]|uniref:serine/threonine-protein kinase phg2 isoform X2 n=2 Tax=Drosophila montana TaxID=40370 RepID=UPI00313D7D78